MKALKWLIPSQSFWLLIISCFVVLGYHRAIQADTSNFGAKKVMVLRVYFHDYAANSRYNKTQVDDFFNVNLNQLWKNTSYGNVSITAVVSDLYQLTDNRNLYIDDFSDGDLSNGGKFGKVLTDAISNAPAGLDWSNVDQVMVVMAETSAAQYHRGQATKCNLNMGPGGPVKYVGCAIFSENPADLDKDVWGRWAHEMGHAFQQAGPAHPSNYNNNFELMDASYPGQTGPFEKQANQGFPGWLPDAKYQIADCQKGGDGTTLYAMEFDPASQPDKQALKIKLTDSFYYMVSVRRAVNGDDIDPIMDEGVILERVSEGSDPVVKVIGRGQAPSCSGECNRNVLWKEGDTFTGDGLNILVTKKFDSDHYFVNLRCNDLAFQPDVMLNSWTQPPGNTWETTDIWIDSPVNGFGSFSRGLHSDLAGGIVPIGNGDNPAVGQTNRIYARVRNVGNQAATNVVVNWEITDPPGVGINGASGWAAVGSATQANFPGLANIPAGGTVDVYTDWTPNFPLTPEQLAAGNFNFHTCLRVKLNNVPGELVFGNQDGNGEQENITYFQAPAAPGPGVKFSDVIKLRNPDFVKKQTFYLSHKSSIPDDWTVDLNGGAASVELAPQEVKEIPIIIRPGPSPQQVGTRFSTDVEASFLNMLQNDLNPKDIHPEYKSLGGVQVESRVLQKTGLSCRGDKIRSGFEFVGNLAGIGDFYPKEGLKIQVVGVDAKGKLVPCSNSLSEDRSGAFAVAGDGSVKGACIDPNLQATKFSCLFAGNEQLMSASSGYTPFGEQTDSDGDGIADYVDNCTKVKNPDQRDTDADGFGNACDADFNNDCKTNALDLGLFKKVFGVKTEFPDLRAAADFNGDGKVNALDLGVFKKMFGTQPGDSVFASCLK